MPFKPDEFSDDEIMNIVLYGHICKEAKSIFVGPFGHFPCNLCRWCVDFHLDEFEIIFQLYKKGVGCLCQWCQITLFWELKKRNLSLNIGKVVYS
jgi:hypothetical protein